MRTNPKKPLPELKTLMHGNKTAKKRQSMEEQISIAQMWHAAVTRH